METPAAPDSPELRRTAFAREVRQRIESSPTTLTLSTLDESDEKLRAASAVANRIMGQLPQFLEHYLKNKPETHPFEDWHSGERGISFSASHGNGDSPPLVINTVLLHPTWQKAPDGRPLPAIYKIPDEESSIPRPELEIILQYADLTQTAEEKRVSGSLSWTLMYKPGASQGERVRLYGEPTYSYGPAISFVVKNDELELFFQQLSEKIKARTTIDFLQLLTNDRERALAELAQKFKEE